MYNQFVLCTADLSIDGATFAVFYPEHGEVGAIYRQVSCAQYKLIIDTPLDRGSLPLQNYICTVLGSRLTVKLAVAFLQFLCYLNIYLLLVHNLYRNLVQLLILRNH